MATNMSFDGPLYEIFSWLPTNPLYRLSTVAKPCLEFLSETSFVEKQCVNSGKKLDESLIIQDDYVKYLTSEVTQICFLPENHSFKGVPQKSLDFLARKGRVLASSNGLLLCMTFDTNESPTLFLCNPMTKSWSPIPELCCRKGNAMDIAFICGKSFGKKDYKFPLNYTLLMFEIHDLDVWDSGYDVYTLDEGKWILKTENLLTGGRNLNFDEQVFCNNGLYIMSNSSDSIQEGSPSYFPYVFHYNVEDGHSKSKVLALPPEAHESFYHYDCCFRLFGWERHSNSPCFESLCLVKDFDNFITIWELNIETNNNDNSNSPPWRWLMSIDIVNDLQQGFKDPYSWTKNYTIMGKNLIFANDEGHIIRYYLEGENFGNLEMICNNGYSRSSHKLRFHPYTTTLRPCVKDLIEHPLKI